MVLDKIKDVLSGGEKEEKEEESEKREIALDEMRDIIEEKKEQSREEVEDDVAPLLESISNVLDKINSLQEDLSNAEPREEVHPNLLKSSKEAKRLLLKKLERASGRIEVPEDPDWDELLDFNRSLQKTNNLLKNAIVSHGKQVGAIFSEKLDRLRRLTQKLKDLSKELNTSLRKRKLNFDDFDELSESIDERKEILGEKSDLEEEIEDLKSQKEEVEEDLEDERESLDSLEKSQRFERLQEMKEEKKRLNQRKERTLKKIDSMISDLARPLRKMEKMIERDKHMVGKKVLRGLDLYLDDPAQAVLSEEEGLPKLKATMKELKTLLDGKMKLGDRERRKRLEEVRSIIDEDGIEELRESYYQSEGRIEELEEEIESSSLLEKKKNLEKSIEENKAKLDEEEEKIKEIEEELSKMKNRLEEKNKEIREKADSLLNAEVKELNN